MSTIFDYALVAVLAILAGGWAVPSGIVFGLDPVGVWLASSAGSSLGLAVMTLAAGRGAGSRPRPGSGDGATVHHRARSLVDRWGVVGLAVGGTVVLGPTVTVVAAVTLGIDRRRFLVLAICATVALNAGLAVAWAAVL